MADTAAVLAIDGLILRLLLLLWLTIQLRPQRFGLGFGFLSLPNQFIDSFVDFGFTG